MLQCFFAFIDLFIYIDFTLRQSTPFSISTSSPYILATFSIPLTSMLYRKRQYHNSSYTLLSPVLTLHCGHFWAFLCPCSMTLAQFRSSLSPFLYSRHLRPSCQGAWHLKHHTNWQLLHWIYSRDRRHSICGLELYVEFNHHVSLNNAAKC